MKKKLFVSVMSLVMAIILMTSTSFAWFTVSKNAEVTSVAATMQATENLEIAKAKTGAENEISEVTVKDTGEGSDNKWGSTISELTGATINFPATYNDGFKTVKYAEDGRTDGLEAITWSTPTLTNGVGTLSHTPTNAGSSKNVAGVYGVWLRTNVAGAVKVTINTTSASVGSATLATDKSAADCVKAVVYDGTNFIQSGGTITLTANTPKLVYVCVYADGESVIAKTVASSFTLSGIGVKFEKQ